MANVVMKKENAKGTSWKGKNKPFVVKVFGAVLFVIVVVFIFAVCRPAKMPEAPVSPPATAKDVTDVVAKAIAAVKEKADQDKKEMEKKIEASKEEAKNNLEKATVAARTGTLTPIAPSILVAPPIPILELIDQLGEKTPQVALGAAHYLIGRSEEAKPELIKALANEKLRSGAVWCLVRIGESAVKPLVSDGFALRNETVRQVAAQTVVRIGGQTAWRELNRAVNDANPRVAYTAQEALGLLYEREGKEAGILSVRVSASLCRTKVEAESAKAQAVKAETEKVDKAFKEARKRNEVYEETVSELKEKNRTLAKTVTEWETAARNANRSHREDDIRYTLQLKEIAEDLRKEVAELSAKLKRLLPAAPISDLLICPPGTYPVYRQ